MNFVNFFLKKFTKQKNEKNETKIDLDNDSTDEYYYIDLNNNIKKVYISDYNCHHYHVLYRIRDRNFQMKRRFRPQFKKNAYLNLPIYNKKIINTSKDDMTNGNKDNKLNDIYINGI